MIWRMSEKKVGLLSLKKPCSDHLPETKSVEETAKRISLKTSEKNCITHWDATHYGQRPRICATSLSQNHKFHPLRRPPTHDSLADLLYLVGEQFYSCKYTDCYLCILVWVCTISKPFNYFLISSVLRSWQSTVILLYCVQKWLKMYSSRKAFRNS